MKKIILLSFILLASFTGICQTLQFSQVILITNSSQTVPTGKVWKIEKIVTNDPMNANLYGANFGVIINGTTYYFNDTTLPGNTLYFPGSSVGPMWLPENTTLATKNSNGLMSVIEFTVIP